MKSRVLVPIAVCAVYVLVGCLHRQSVQAETAGATYKITNGACGKLVYVRKVAPTYDEAVAILKTAKEKQWRKTLNVVPNELTIEKSDKVAPTTKFFALEFITQKGNETIHSWSEVVSTDGELYQLDWCPD